MTTTPDLEVALVIGAHAIDVPATLDAFRSPPGVTLYPQDLHSFVRDMGDARGRYDLVVFYNFHGTDGAVTLSDDAIDDAMTALRTIGDEGLGILVLHHGIAAFPGSREWAELTGIPGESLSGAHHDETFVVDVVDPDHPIAPAVDSFELRDETYTMAEPDEDSHVILRTDFEPSMDALGWTREYRNSRVFCFQSGHGEAAFSTPEVIDILDRGMQWVAGER